MEKEIQWLTPTRIRRDKMTTADLLITKTKIRKYENLRFSFKAEMCELICSNFFRIGFDVEHGAVYVAADPRGYALEEIRRSRRKFALIRVSAFSGFEDLLLGEYVFLRKEENTLVFERRCE